MPLGIGRFGAPGVSTPPATQIIQSQVKFILVSHVHSIMFANLNISSFSSLHQHRNDQVKEETGEVVVVIVPTVGR